MVMRPACGAGQDRTLGEEDDGSREHDEERPPRRGAHQEHDGSGDHRNEAAQELKAVELMDSTHACLRNSQLLWPGLRPVPLPACAQGEISFRVLCPTRRLPTP